MQFLCWRITARQSRPAIGTERRGRWCWERHTEWGCLDRVRLTFSGTFRIIAGGIHTSEEEKDETVLVGTRGACPGAGHGRLRQAASVGYRRGQGCGG